MNITARITSKGQVTIPKKIRDLLNSQVVEFVVENDRIEVRAVSSVAAGLKKYATAYVPLSDVRDVVWGKDDRKTLDLSFLSLMTPNHNPSNHPPAKDTPNRSANNLV